MKNHKGFIVPLLIIIAVLLVCGGYYIYIQNNKKIPITAGNNQEELSDNYYQPFTIPYKTVSGVPVSIATTLCDTRKGKDILTCFGSGARPGKTVNDLTLWDMVSTDTQYNLGVQTLSADGKDMYFSIAADFGNYKYTDKDVQEVNNMVLETFPTVK